jgi:conjugal transfer ATP-binding protein TraC
MLATLRTSLFGEEGAAEGFTGLFGLGGKDESPADQFASWLPYVAYLDEEQLFVNRDGIGFLLEIMPQSGADDRMVEVLISLYANCPAATGIQFHLFASPHIRPQLRRYANLRMEDADQLSKAQRWGRPARNDNLFRVLARPAFRPPDRRRPGLPDAGLPLHDAGLPADDERHSAGRPVQRRTPRGDRLAA